MPPLNETMLCRYHYGPLDRLVDCAPLAQSSVRRFYLKDRLATEVQGSVQRSIMQHEDQLLAQQQRQGGNMETGLLATDQQRSALNVLDATRTHPLAYTPYGHRPAENGLLSLLGFNGERPDPVTGWYLLGNGYRAFIPVLMRFNSPDNLSPFGKGGLNAYAYCLADPVNRRDPNGHWSIAEIVRSIWESLVHLGRRIISRASGPENAVGTPVNRIAGRNSIDNIAPINRSQTSSISTLTSTPASSRRFSDSSFSDDFEFKGVRLLKPERRRPVVLLNLEPEEWEDLERVLTHASADATTGELTMMIDQMRDVRTGRTTNENAMRFLEQFIGN